MSFFTTPRSLFRKCRTGWGPIMVGMIGEGAGEHKRFMRPPLCICDVNHSIAWALDGVSAHDKRASSAGLHLASGRCSDHRRFRWSAGRPGNFETLLVGSDRQNIATHPLGDKHVTSMAKDDASHKRLNV
jgi:hypothetical protein